ncbi:interleukin-26 [Danio aesculapii]|uniref:interleukin-26 n=1 Tax=Danio aesculapii TaxID=1142201 RepID=UPI0024C0A3E5|nr:interleukin-26 [Danio aesculapii]
MRILILFALCALLYWSEGHKQEECLKREIRLPMIREMLSMSQDIHKSLPRDNKPFHRILGKLKKCKELNVPDFKRVLEIYDEHVFEKMWDELPTQFIDYFKRLKGIMQNCATEGKPTQSRCAKEKLKKFEHTLMKLQPDGKTKALSEFHSVLLWISSGMDRRKTYKKIH